MSILQHAKELLQKSLGEDLLGAEPMPVFSASAAAQGKGGSVAGDEGEGEGAEGETGGNGASEAAAEDGKKGEKEESEEGGKKEAQENGAGGAEGLNLIIRVKREAWQKTGRLVRDELDCQWFDFLSAIDWMESPYGRQMDAEQDTAQDVNTESAQPKSTKPLEWGILGGETRLQILARVRSVEEHPTGEPLGIILKADLPDEEPIIDSWVSVYPGADWHERETWEMFGIGFRGHPGLRHIYLPTGFEGYPLRKDFPLLARKIKPWPGIVDVEGMAGEVVSAGDVLEEGAAEGEAEPTEAEETA